MRLPRTAAVTATALGAGLAAFAAAPAAQAAQPGAIAAVAPGISSVPMLPGPAAHRDRRPGAAADRRHGAAAIAAGMGGMGAAVPHPWLETSISGPVFADGDEAYYRLGVTNPQSSQQAATGVVVSLATLACTRPDEPDAQCAQGSGFAERIGSLAPGQSYTRAVAVELPEGIAVPNLRLTPEIAHVDRHFAGDVSAGAAGSRAVRSAPLR